MAIIIKGNIIWSTFKPEMRPYDQPSYSGHIFITNFIFFLLSFQSLNTNVSTLNPNHSCSVD